MTPIAIMPKGNPLGSLQNSTAGACSHRFNICIGRL